jgi:hypothetical protein
MDAIVDSNGHSNILPFFCPDVDPSLFPLLVVVSGNQIDCDGRRNPPPI